VPVFRAIWPQGLDLRSAAAARDRNSPARLLPADMRHHFPGRRAAALDESQEQHHAGGSALHY